MEALGIARTWHCVKYADVVAINVQEEARYAQKDWLTESTIIAVWEYSWSKGLTTPKTGLDEEWLEGSAGTEMGSNSGMSSSPEELLASSWLAGLEVPAGEMRWGSRCRGRRRWSSTTGRWEEIHRGYHSSSWLELEIKSGMEDD